MKYSFRTYILGTLAAALLPLTGCTDDFLADNTDDFFNSGAIGFDAMVDVAASSGTRSDDDLYEPLVLNADNEDYPLYLHTWEHPYGEGVVGSESGYGSSSTRGEQVNNRQDFVRLHKSFAVKGTRTNGDTYIAMQNTRLVNSSNLSVWTTEVAQRWPGNETLSFNAIAPYNVASGLGCDFSENRIEFDYAALKSSNGTQDAEAQIDLMMATATMNREGTQNYNNRVPLNFNHALSAIKFAVRDVLKGKVVSIKIIGVKGSGHCVYTAEPESENGKFEWTNLAGNETYNQVFDYTIANDGNFDPTDDTQDIVINNTMPTKTFMLIPQEIPADAMIEAVIERDNVAPGQAPIITVRGKIRDNEVTEWKPGYEYVYTISTSKSNWVYIFDAEGNEAEGSDNIYVYAPGYPEFDEYGNNADFYVVSYRYKANNQNYIEPLPWKANHGGSYSYDVSGGNDAPYPDEGSKLDKWIEWNNWITDTFRTPLSGDGSVQREKHPLVFYPHYVATDWVGDKDMQSYGEYGTEDHPYDLSTFGGQKGITTANCYVIDRGGWYMLPLVYGNAYKDGQAITESYVCQSTDATDRLLYLTDYNGNAITSPDITNLPANARPELAWQDAYAMIDENSVQFITVGEKKMIRFFVEKNNLQQGNAVIALTAGDNTSIGKSTVIWSWHIWVTEHWIDKDSRLPHVFDTGNAKFNTYVSSKAKDEYGNVIGYRQAGDVQISYLMEGRSFMMSPYNLGWCDPKKVLYLKRKDNMAFVQYMPDKTTPTGHTDNLPIIQQGNVIDYKIGNNTYYQWGRKDPMRGYFNRTSTYKVAFGPRQPEMEGQRNKTIKDGIQKPNVLFAGDGDASNNQDWLQNGGFKNLWNNDANVGTGTVRGPSNDSKVYSHTKTVYDPCPAGYMVPNAGVWYFISKGTPTNYGGDYGDLGWLNGRLNGAWINNYNYKVYGVAPDAPHSDNDAIFFATTGHRWFSDNWNAGVPGLKAGDNFNPNVFYAWSNRWMDGTKAHCVALGLDVNDDRLEAGDEPSYVIASQFMARKAMARPVRPIREP